MLTNDLLFAVQSDQARHSSWGWQNDRKVFWQSVADRFQAELSEGRIKISDVELAKLRRLGKGVIWMEMVSDEHRSIYEAIYKELSGKEMPASSRIEKDVPRTFGIFNTDWMGKMRHKLEQRQRYGALNRLLNAMSSMTGYSQGMNFLAAVLMLEVSEADAFCLLSVVLRQRCLATVFENDSSGLLDYMNLFEDLLKEYVPRVWHHFQDQQFNSIMYAIEWFTTLFAVSGRLNLVLCVFDLFICGFKDILLRVGLAICKVLEKEVLLLDEEQLQLNFKRMVRRLTPEEVIPLALTAQLSLGEKDILQKLQDRMDEAGPIKEMSPQQEEIWRNEIRHMILHKLGTDMESDSDNSSISQSSRVSSMSSITSVSSVEEQGRPPLPPAPQHHAVVYAPDETGDSERKDALKLWLEMRMEATGGTRFSPLNSTDQTFLSETSTAFESKAEKQFTMPALLQNWFSNKTSARQRSVSRAGQYYDADAELSETDTSSTVSSMMEPPFRQGSRLLEAALEQSRPMDSSEEGKFRPSWPVENGAEHLDQPTSDSEDEFYAHNSNGNLMVTPLATTPQDTLRLSHKTPGSNDNEGPDTPDISSQAGKLELLHRSFQTQQEFQTQRKNKGNNLHREVNIDDLEGEESNETNKQEIITQGQGNNLHQEVNIDDVEGEESNEKNKQENSTHCQGNNMHQELNLEDNADEESNKINEQENSREGGNMHKELFLDDGDDAQNNEADGQDKSGEDKDSLENEKLRLELTVSKIEMPSQETFVHNREQRIQHEFKSQEFHTPLAQTPPPESNREQRIQHEFKSQEFHTPLAQTPPERNWDEQIQCEFRTEGFHTPLSASSPVAASPPEEGFVHTVSKAQDQTESQGSKSIQQDDCQPNPEICEEIEQISLKNDQIAAPPSSAAPPVVL